MNFFEFHRYESDAATQVSPFEKWAKRVEVILGHDLDGDQQRDGYSLDFALVAFENGMTPQAYATTVVVKA